MNAKRKIIPIKGSPPERSRSVRVPDVSQYTSVQPVGVSARVAIGLGVIVGFGLLTYLMFWPTISRWLGL